MRIGLWILGLAVLLAACGGQRSRVTAPAELVNAEATAPQIDFAVFPKFGDTDAWEWEGRGPRAYPVHGIDVSKWQDNVDWHTARTSGVAFAFVKATEGGDYLDPKFRDHWAAAKRAGVRRGAYHFYYFCRPAEEQARWFIRNVPKDDSALPHVLDMEWNPHSPSCTLRPDGAQVRAEARKFLNILERHYGRRPIVYTTLDFYRETGIGRLPGTQFWLRSVAGHPGKVYDRSHWVFWQYTGTGVVPGIPGPVDINVFAGSPETFLRWATPQASSG